MSKLVNPFKSVLVPGGLKLITYLMKMNTILNLPDSPAPPPPGETDKHPQPVGLLRQRPVPLQQVQPRRQEETDTAAVLRSLPTSLPLLTPPTLWALTSVLVILDSGLLILALNWLEVTEEQPLLKDCYKKDHLIRKIWLWRQQLMTTLFLMDWYRWWL